MTVSLVIQRITEDDSAPGDDAFNEWVETALRSDHYGQATQYSITIRLVDEEESRQLNCNYRGRDSATNVLSFPADLPALIQSELESDSGTTLLGDLVICVPVVKHEAQEQGKPLLNHWTHLVIHGVLHLLGHDHADSKQAESMEQLEKDMLATLGINDPYLVS